MEKYEFSAELYVYLPSHDFTIFNLRFCSHFQASVEVGISLNGTTLQPINNQVFEYKFSKSWRQFSAAA